MARYHGTLHVQSEVVCDMSILTGHDMIHTYCASCHTLILIEHVACTYRTIAHFLRPVDDIEGEEVTLVTQASMDRLPRLEEQALALGNAPLSVAIYVPFFPAPSRAACRCVLFLMLMLGQQILFRTLTPVRNAERESFERRRRRP